MSAWKVIASVFLIFAAGFVSGGLALRKPAPLPVSAPVASPANTPAGYSPVLLRQRADMLPKMEKHLNLTPEQRNRIADLIRQSHDRTEPMVKDMGARVRQELRTIREQIRTELTSEQQEKFEEIFKPRPRRPADPDGRRRAPSTNTSARTRAPAGPGN